MGLSMILVIMGCECNILMGPGLGAACMRSSRICERSSVLEAS